MKPKDIAFATLAIIASTLFVRLGVWQLDRLGERREFNERLRSRADATPQGLGDIPADTGSAHYMRVNFSGEYDFGREIVLTLRSRNGSPGINIVTPLKVAGTDTAVLVNRGWVYAPDGMSADLARWHEPRQTSGDAYVETFRAGTGPTRATTIGNGWRWMDFPTLSRAFPYPIAPYYLVLIGETENPPENIPPRVPVPPLDEGPHKGYAFQWFAFAAVSFFGMILYLRRK